MYFSEIYSIFFLDGFFHILYLFEKWEIFMPHPVFLTFSALWVFKNWFPAENSFSSTSVIITESNLFRILITKV